MSFRAPRVALHLQTIWPHLPTLLARIDAHAAGLAALSDTLADTRVQRSRGRDLADWEGLRDWFTLVGRAVRWTSCGMRPCARPAVAAGQRQTHAALGCRGHVPP
ncbi:DUF2397 family protein [Streptomyces sp. NPDC002547]